MITCDEIQAYIDYAYAHPSWINKERWQLIRNIVVPLLKRDDVYFDADTFHNCVRYCENNYYPLFTYQKFIYAFAFFYWKKTEYPVFPKIVILMGRGNGKDGCIVPLANFFQTPLYDAKEFNIEIVANEESQASDTFKVAYNMLKGNPKFKGKFRITLTEITNTVTFSRMRFNTSNASTKDGKKIGLLILNEVHAYENYDQINVFESALGKVSDFKNGPKCYPREIVISTQGYVRDGPLDDILTCSKTILETGNIDLGILPFLCKVDNVNEIDSQDAWHKANPSLEYMPILLDTICKAYREAKLNPNKMPEFYTKRCNLPAQKAGDDQVTSWNNILRCCYSDIELKTPRPVPSTDGKLAVIGIDYADLRDFASAGVLTKDDSEDYIWRQHTWIDRRSPTFDSIKFPFSSYGQPGHMDYSITDAPVIPVDEIVQYCLNQMKIYNVVKIALDTYRYTLFKTAFEQAGITIETKENPYGIVRLIRRVGSVSVIMSPFIQAQFETGHIIYGDSAMMRWMTNNTSIITDKYGNKQFGKIEPKLRKNDGFVAFVAAMYCKDQLEEVVIYV